MRKKQKFVFLSFVGVFLLIGWYWISGNHSIKASPEEYEQYQVFNSVNTPGVHILNNDGTDAVSGQAVELPGDFGTSFKLTDKIGYEVSGEDTTIIPQGLEKTKIFRFKKADLGKEKSVLVKNAAVYNGRDINLKLVIDEMNFQQDPNINFIAVGSVKDGQSSDFLPVSTNSAENWGKLFLFFGSGNRNGVTNTDIWDKYEVNDSISYHYEFFDAKSGAPLDFKGVWNFSNINGLKAVSAPQNKDDFSDVYVRNLTDVRVKTETKSGLTVPGFSEFYGSGSRVGLDSSKVSKLVSGEEYSMNMQRRSANSNTASSAMAILYDTTSIVRIAPAKPIVFGERNSAKHDDPDYLKLKYSILQTIADNVKNAEVNNRSTTFKIDTQVPDYYELKKEDIKIFEYGSTVDITDKVFNIVITGGNKATIEAKDSTSDEFNGKVFDIQVVANPSPSFDFKNNKAAYNYQNSGPDNGYMTDFEMAGSATTASYTFVNPKTNISQTLISETNTEQTQSQVLYEGVPYGTAKEDLKIPMGGNIATAFPEAKELLSSYDVDTENEIDRPVTVSYVGTPPNISTNKPGDIVEVPLMLTSAKGVETPITVKIEITQTIFDLDIEHLDAETGAAIATTSPLPSGEEGVEYIATSEQIKGYIPSAVLVDGVDKTPSPITDPLSVTVKFVTNKKVTFKYTKLRTPVIKAEFDVSPTTVPLGGKATYTATVKNTAEAPTAWGNVSFKIDTPFPDKITPDVSTVKVNGVALEASKVDFDLSTKEFKIDLSDLDLDENEAVIKYDVIVAADAAVQVVNQTYTVSGAAGDGSKASQQSNSTSLNVIRGESQLNVLYRKKDETNNDVKMDPDRDTITTQKDGTAFDITPETFDGYVLDKIIVDGQVLPEPLPTSVKGKYGEISTIEFHYKGTLLITSAPTLLDFEMNEASAKNLRVESAKTDKDLVVTDTRATKQRWYLYAKVTEDFKTTDGSNKTLSGILRYNDGGTTEKNFPVDQNQLLTSPDNFSDTKYNISQTWSAKGKGFKVEVPGDYVKKLGEYRAKIVYTLSEVPDLP